jgi:hypothetical protein
MQARGAVATTHARRPSPELSSRSARLRHATAALVSLTVACGSLTPTRRLIPAASPASPTPPSKKAPVGEVASYRLPLRDNPVDPGDAFRCYGHCQEETNPRQYLACLSDCPGFEITPGEACDAHDVPPVAACLTVRKIPNTEQVDSGLVVLAVVGSFLLVVGAVSLCASSHSQCGVGVGY